MRLDELNKVLEENPIEWKFEGNSIIFRHLQFDGENEGTRIEIPTIDYLTPEVFLKTLINGRNVDHITRVTGYMSKVSGWNKGKTGELKDRVRGNIE